MGKKLVEWEEETKGTALGGGGGKREKEGEVVLTAVMSRAAMMVAQLPGRIERNGTKRIRARDGYLWTPNLSACRLAFARLTMTTSYQRSNRAGCQTDIPRHSEESARRKGDASFPRWAGTELICSRSLQVGEAAA
jgi:hypothetical protein